MFERFRVTNPIALPFPPLILALLAFLTARLPAELPWLRVIHRATRGAVSQYFVISVIGIGIVLALVVWIGGIGLDDAGMNRDHVGRGIGVAVMIWAAAQVLGVLPRVVANRPVALDRTVEHGPVWGIGSHLLDALGTATIQEIVLRGFLLVQLYLLLGRKSSSAPRRFSIPIGIMVIVASLVALPGVLPYAGARAAIQSQVMIVALGLFLAWIFLRTRNLFFTIGVHALILAPTPVVAGPRGGEAWFFPGVIVVLATVWALLWPRRD